MNPSACTHQFSSSVHPSPRTHQFSVHPSFRTHQFSVNPSACAHQFSENPSACTHQFSENPSTCTHQFSENPSACTHQFSENPSASTHQFSENPSACTHQFSSENPSACTHQFSSVHPSQRTHAFTVCALTKYTPPFLTNGSCPSPSLKKDFFARCASTPFSHTTYTQDRFRHVHHMEIIPFRLTANFQPDLSLSVFLERFSVCSSETSCTIRLFQCGVPKPLGTHIDRGSAVDHHQTFMGSWVPLPGCLFMGSWVPIPGCFPFFNFHGQ